ncbi:Protein MICRORCHIDIA like [Actinidia chinensis var. chinensis]|uniref:Protein MICRORCHIDIA like n=1 Tax=Actinidia chinensis var. chinensis TaxID=1590841 RepID=A0A2R6RYZ4_ACTCC|nr:Protein MICRORCHIDIA like [Actinidia chinensis var. chinensis]
MSGDDYIGKSSGTDSKKGMDCVLGASEQKGKTKTKIKIVCRKSKTHSIGEESQENRSSVAFSISQNDSSVLDQRCSPVDEASPSSVTSFGPAPICRQFWKAGNYDMGEGSKSQLRKGKNHLHVHPMFLHSNATSHKWAFGAIAELLDNAIDEIRNGATFVAIDKTTNPRDGNPALLIQDDGAGMDPETIRRCMSFGFSDKKMKSSIGQYGNGFKTSSMRLGADVVVFTSHLRKRKLSQSVGLLSYTFLRQTGQDRIVVPLVDYEFNLSTGKLRPIFSLGKDHFSSNLSVLLQWSPYSTEEMLLKQFDDIGHQGTKIVIYNLWLNDDGAMELDFDFDVEDIRVNADPKLLQTGCHPNPVSDQHIANLYRYSLRVYSSILYLRLPQSFKIILRGRVVEHHNIANDLKFPEFILYKPHDRSTEAAVVTTIGFLKDAPHVNIHGFNIYHKNRLILPFWRVKNSTNNTARGVVGILEANFVEPTHNKQDFEKTSLFQKLEARLRDMTVEYWRFHCGSIGYQLVKRTPKAPKPSQEPLLSKAHSSVQPVVRNNWSSVSDDATPVSPAVGSFEDAVAAPSYVSTRIEEESVDNHSVRSWQGLNAKRKQQNAAAELGHGKKHTGSRSFSTDTQQNVVEQPADFNENQFQEEEFTSLMQENKKLRTQLLEFERREEDLNLKVQRLRRELDGLESEYVRMLAESEAMDKIKVEKNVEA